MSLELLAWDKATDSAIQPERAPLALEWARHSNGVRKQYVEPTSKITTPAIDLTNLVIDSPATLKGNIYWLKKDTDAVVTADLLLPDGDYMIMAERVINATSVVDDVRFVATITSGIFTMTVNFPSTGNYLLTAKRMNEGLDRIGAAVHLAFDDVEFDIYV